MNAALALEGRILPNGWLVGPVRVPASDATGGVFSVSYPVSKDDGTQGFLKVLNLGLAMQQQDVVGTLLWMTSQFSAERDLCVMCGERRLSKIVTAIDHGSLQLAEYAPLSSVSYIVFEMATHDVRRAMSLHAELDEVIRLEYLHSIAMGLRQLHGIKVAHQDLKPSNFLVFPPGTDGRATGKIADLGRAYRADQPNSLDSETIPGDRNYAPPEQLYRYSVPDERGRRYGADLFQLGNMVCFLFTGRTMNAMLGRVLDPQLHWRKYGDSYQTVLPYLEEAYSRIVAKLEEKLTSSAGRDVVRIVAYLCEPDYEKRGHPGARKQAYGSPYGLERVISDFDLAARRAAARVNR
ncbi:hypothetical protein [Microbacterium sp. lyk4-40-TSB-66]|uniref:protein kinase domain-containing protein n=1 Tax=Microbacterium sp. lyk4-40-TSB-66 TaxID=3040294 RepID=UPI00254AB6A0|nr:hypothetical protein [Microbacterium sp. lyk4-40-TSB-66]